MKKSIVVFFMLMNLLCYAQTENMTNIEAFFVVGISMESTNENGKSINDMGDLWGRFYSEGISEKIPNKQSMDVYSIFTDYESDYSGSYRAIIGHRVTSIENIPEDLYIKEITGGKYLKQSAQGKMPEAIVAFWKEVWKNDAVLNRAYVADFEIYDENSNKGKDSEVSIYLSIK